MNETNPVAVLVMFSLLCFLVITAFVRMQQRERWALVRGLVQIVGIQIPARSVSTVSARRPSDPSAASSPIPARVTTPIMSNTQRRTIKQRQIRGVRRADRAAKLENQKLADELKTAKLALCRVQEEASEGQRKGVRIYLEKIAAKKVLTRKDVTLLLGKDTTAGLQLIGDVDAEIETERRLRAPLPPEIARPEPIPV